MLSFDKWDATLFWFIHRMVLDGKSSVSGAPLPEKIEQCPKGAQEAHYAFSVMVAFATDVIESMPDGSFKPRNLPPCPPLVGDYDRDRIVKIISDHLFSGKREATKSEIDRLKEFLSVQYPGEMGELRESDFENESPVDIAIRLLQKNHPTG